MDDRSGTAMVVTDRARTRRDDDHLRAADERITIPGRNCWRREHAERVAFLVDGQAYFDAFAAAVERAERAILIVTWDIDSRTPLCRAPASDFPDRLGPFLNAVVSRRPGLHAYVLSWDFAMIYALEREPLPIVKLGWRTHRRLRFRLDGRHPLGACHHQKIVVVDDAVAFSGGLDLCTHRWDTRAHRAIDPRRRDAAGRPYGPFHDVQMAVDGAAAAALGTLVRTRWYRATGRNIAAPSRPGGDPWPELLVPDVRDVDVAIARTEPAWSRRPEVREVETLFLDAIRAARRSLYIENQYFTSPVIAGALAARLREGAGPDVVLVLPSQCSGWLEETTMGVLRAAVLRQLRAADHHGRLRVYCPIVPDLAVGCVNVHSKVMVVDDRLVRVGSANLSNRSMGFDTECDLAIEAGGEARVAGAVAAFRDGLLAEHLDVAPARVAEAIAAQGSLIAAVESLRGRGRTLAPLDVPDPPASAVLAAVALADPERPVDPERLFDELVPEEVRDRVDHPFLRGAALVLGIAVALALWSLMSDRGIGAATVAWTAPLRRSPAALLWVVLGYVAGGLWFVPLTAMTLVTMMTFDLGRGVAYAIVATLASAAVGYVVGRALGRDAVRRLAGGRLNRLTRRLLRRGPRAVAGARVAALVPFTVMNLVAGASRIPAADYALGTVIGTVPGVLAIAVLARALRAALHAIGLRSAVVLAVIGLVLLAVGLRIRRAARMRGTAAPIPDVP